MDFEFLTDELLELNLFLDEDLLVWYRRCRRSAEKLELFRGKAWVSVQASLPLWRMLGLDKAEERGEAFSVQGAA